MAYEESTDSKEITGCKDEVQSAGTKKKKGVFSKMKSGFSKLFRQNSAHNPTNWE